MKDKGIYMSEADLARQIYFKDENTLSNVGHFHDSVEFVFVLEGEIEARHHSEVQRVSAGEIFFAGSFEYHCYKRLTPHIRAVVLVLSREYTRAFYEYFQGQTLPSYMKDITLNKEIIELVLHWLEEKKDDGMFLCNYGYSNLLFGKLSMLYAPVRLTDSGDKRVTIKILKYINEHYQEDISLVSVAKENGYTKEYCSKIFHDVVGMRFREYLNLLRLRKAKEYFSDKERTGLTTIEIIYKCGFNSPATFYRVQKEAKEKNINF